MSNRKGLKCLLVFICCFLLVYTVFAQDKGGADELFADARKAAFDRKDYTTAIRLSKQAIDLAPNYTDIYVFLGRLYSWNKKNDSAEYYFKKALDLKGDFVDAYIAYSDMKIWSGDYENAMQIVDKGLSYSAHSEELLIRKARIYEALKKYKEAAVIVDSILSVNENNIEARTIDVRLRDYLSKNKIGVNFDYIHFDTSFFSDPRFISLAYTRQTGIGPISAKLNYANRFNKDGYQIEIESYPRFSKVFYSYINVGCSDIPGVFPKWKGAFSLYANLPHGYEVEGGIRYLFFDSATYFYTAYLGKYYKKYFLGLRGYLVPSKGNRLSHSYSVFGKYYFGGADDFIGITAVYGISPDDRIYKYQLDANNKLTTYKAGIEYKKSIKKLNVIGINLSYTNQKYSSVWSDNQIQVGIGYTRRF